MIQETTNVEVSKCSIFDVQVKMSNFKGLSSINVYGYRVIKAFGTLGMMIGGVVAKPPKGFCVQAGGCGNQPTCAKRAS